VSATRTWLKLSANDCDTATGPTVYLDRINLASRPVGGAPAITP
jgi:hypothetical protein